MTFRRLAVNNVLRNKRIYAGYFASSAFSVLIFFVCALFVYHPDVRSGSVPGVSVAAMLVAEGIVFLFSFLFVLYSIGSFLQLRRREFGILMLHGMTSRQLSRMLFLEQMLIGGAATCAGLGCGILTAKLFLMAGAQLLGIAPLRFAIPGAALGLAVGAYLLLFGLLALLTPLLVRRARLLAGLGPGHAPRREIRASRLLALLAIVLLSTGYTLAATATVETVYVRMLPVTAMTIAGTYLFYTQLGVYLIRLLRRSRSLYWRGTNLLMLSALAYRLKGQARMFFIVTILSAVTFCSVGMFASITTLVRQFDRDYPAAIGYVAKDARQPDEERRQLTQIRGELSRANLAYEELTVSVKRVLLRDPGGEGRADERRSIGVMAYRDYVRIVEASDERTNLAEPGEGEAWVMLGSQRDQALIGVRSLRSHPLGAAAAAVGTDALRERGYTDHVALPDYLAANIEQRDNQGEFTGLVVRNEVYDALPAAETERYTGFYVEDFRQTAGLAKTLAPDGVVRYELDRPYAMTVSGTLYELQRGLYRTMLLAALLAGAVFFIAAGSFLYFRLYADLDEDRRHYAAIAKIGLTERELRRIVTRQLLLLFFVPIAFAMLHSLFAFMALQRFFYVSLAEELGVVLIGFFSAQTLYFAFIRHRYLRKLNRQVQPLLKGAMQ
ncbi:ABC transporter permease [Paenibacillus sp. IB182496]|uniref:ABC transporter permease n=1 Tax=Paenibacillus sabuli TaxID=2772509 RepID=A0A927BTV9_9BACL|nr:ABC transporter permease [Paenibacillus sabuli]MBD2846718.1 ABC transporter permease [Paenibacillus sabuli]